MKSSDMIIRSTGAKTPLRFIVADITETANEIGAKHGAEAWTLSMMAEATIASLFLSASLKYAGTASLRAEFSGDISVIQADTTPMGLCRCTVPAEEVEKTGDFELMLSPQVVRVRKLNEHGKQVSEGIVEMVSTKMSQNLAVYLFQSEQLRTAVGIEAIPDPENPAKLKYAAGFYLEAFPDAKEEELIIMEEVVKNLPPMGSFYKDGKYDLTGLLDQLAGPVEYQIHREITPEAYCPCDKERTLASLKTLPKSELEAMIEENKNFEISCDFCRTKYDISETELQSVLSAVNAGSMQNEEGEES